MQFACEAFDKIKELKPISLLDIGGGSLNHALGFDEAGISVTVVDIKKPRNIPQSIHFIEKPFEDVYLGSQYDCIWCSHVLEHALDPHSFIVKAISHCSPQGILSFTVPPLKHQIVGGHINLFNAGILLYRLILGGLDCSLAQIKQYGYNISIIVRNTKRPSNLPLKYDNGDIETLSQYFPAGYNFQNFNGNIHNLNWD